MLIPSLGGGGRGGGGDFREDVCSLLRTQTRAHIWKSGHNSALSALQSFGQAVQKLPVLRVNISTVRCVRTQVWRLNEKGAFVNLPYITHTHFQPRITYMLQGKTFRGPHCDRQHKYAHPIIGELFTPTSPANKGRKRRSRDQGADP